VTKVRDDERKRLEKDAKAAHSASKETEVERLNAELAETYDEIDSLLAATLQVDDYVDLEKLRQRAKHPPFDRADLDKPVPPPDPIPDPPEPRFTPPEPPKGLFASKKKHTIAVEKAEADYAVAHSAWKKRLEWNEAKRKEAATAHEKAERERIVALEKERTRYEAECAAREAEIAKQNAKIDTLITNLGYGTVDAVQEYVSIVLANTVYPEQFPVDHDFTFDPSTAELKMRVLVPPPSKLPDIKAYKYTKSTDEITHTTLSQKACKDRYANAVYQVALRSLHEVFEADRRGLIKSISLEVGTETVNPATGKLAYIPFVAVAADRKTFMEFDLSEVVPAATLDHLGASVSKSPFGLVSADSTGIRTS
jgi:restriction system protein